MRWRHDSRAFLHQLVHHHHHRIQLDHERACDGRQRRSHCPAKGSGGFNYTQGSYLEGFEFTAKSPITITKLGAYDSNLSSLPNGSETFATVSGRGL